MKRNKVFKKSVILYLIIMMIIDITIDANTSTNSKAPVIFLSQGHFSKTNFINSGIKSNFTKNRFPFISQFINGKSTSRREKNTSNPKKVIGLILDSSGSMSANDPNDARIKTAQKIIQLLNGSEHVYIIDFDEKAKWINKNNFNNWDTEQLISQINTIDSDGGTDIGKALLKMKEAISSTNKGSVCGGVILFTDGKGDYNEEANWFQEHNIPVYTISFTQNSDALLLNKIATMTGGQYLMAKNEIEAINALDYFFSKLYDFNLFFSETDILNPYETKWYSFFVDNHTKQLLVSAGWLHGKIDLSLISPSGKLFNNVTKNKGVDYFESENFVSYKIANAEKGEWKVKLYGNIIPKGGERIVFDASGNSPYHIHSNALIDTTYGVINFEFSGLNNNNATIDLIAVTPSLDTITMLNKQINNKLVFIPLKGEGNYNFKIELTSKIDGNTLKRHFYKSVLVGNNVSSNIGSVIHLTGTIVKISIGQWAGNFPGLTCYLYDMNNTLLARGTVISVKSKYSIIKITQYYSNSNSSLILPGYPVKLDYLQWLNDN